MISFYMPQVQKAKRPKWKRTRTPRRQEALSQAMQRAVSVDLLRGLHRFKLRVDKEQIYQAWLRGDYADLMRIIPWEELPGDMEPVAARMRRQLPKVTSIATEALPAPVRPHLRFDMHNPRIRRYAERQVGKLVVKIESETREFIANAVARKFDTAMTPRRVADMIRPQIGLDPRRATALQNYRRGLEESGVGEARVQRMADAYEDRLLRSRSMTIARTETRQLENHGQMAVWNEAFHQGLISRETKKVYQVDGAPCEICEPMDGQTVLLSEPFETEDGDQYDFPPIHPNCMCSVTLDADSMGD